jgi:hypothetical protein
MTAAALLDLLGWDQLTAVEQAWAATGGAAGLATVLAAVLVANKGRHR